MKITICGSIKFYKEMESVKDKLLKLDHQVKIPKLDFESLQGFIEDKKVYFSEYIKKNGGIDAFPAEHKLWSFKEKAINDHYKKINWSDGVLIINCEKRGIDGYIGGNTLIEIGVAFYQKKKIYILNPVSSKLSYKEEIMGMRPIVLNGDLSLIK